MSTQEDKRVMTDDTKPPPQFYGVHARLNPPPHEIAAAVDEYRARQAAERAKMAKLRKLRLEAEAKAASKSKAKRKPSGKGKR